MRKIIFAALLLLAYSAAFATNIWVSTSGTNTGTSTSANPWSTTWYLAHKNQVSGDTIRFKRGDVFPFPIPITDNSGTAPSPVVYDSYGTGAKPVFNTLVTLTSWTLLSGNIYYATVDVPRLQAVTINGVLKPMGRYPKTGYMTINSHSGLSSLTSSSVSAIPFNPAGGEAVIKKFRYIIDRHGITSRSSNTLNITSPSDFGPSGNYPIDDGNGFFVQNHLGTLTQSGDWYYDVAAKRLYVHFGSGNSSSLTVAASLSDYGGSTQARSFIKINNLDIRGGNIAGLNLLYSGGVYVTNCDITNSTEGIIMQEGGGGNFLYGNYIANMYSSGITSVGANNLTITNHIIRDIHTVAGMGRSGDAVGSGISELGGNNVTIYGNRLSNLGYCGIAEYANGTAGGDYLTITGNIVDSFSTVKDDAGGVYTYGNEPQTFVSRKITNNLIKNGIGNVEGVSAVFAYLPFAVGIYLDNYSSDTDVENNFVFDNSGAGIFSHSNKNDTIAYNTLFNNGFEQFLQLSYGTTRTPAETVSGMYVHHNKLIAKTNDQILMKFEMYNNPSNISSMGTFSNNTFYRPFGFTDYIRQDDRSTNSSILTDFTLSSWLSTYSKEQSSINSTIPISGPGDFRIAYNNTGASAVFPLGANYKDVSTGLYQGNISLPAYSGQLLIFSSFLATGGGFIQTRMGPYKFVQQ